MSTRSLALGVALAGLLGLASCRPKEATTITPSRPKGLSESEERRIMDVVRGYIRAQPDWPDPGDLPYVITDHRTYWHVTFEQPEGAPGGVPIICVDKETLQVFGAYHTKWLRH
jgi:hypothetical protein